MRPATSAIIHRAANHPDVLPYSAPGHPSVDLERFCVNPSNIAFGDGNGVILLAYVSPDVYEWHWVLTPTMRGAAALKLGRKVLLEMFTKRGAAAIQGPCPRDNRAARLMNRALGARPVCHSADTIVYRLERKEWAASLVASSAASVA